jgi:hypothetical protein
MPRAFECVTGTYTSTASAQTVTLGFKPSFLIVVNETDGDQVSLKIAGSTDATHIVINTAAASVASNGLTLNTNGFTAGTDTSVCENTKVFRYVAFI